MALISPGVEVTIIDESQYIPAATNSVPYILLATAQNKVSGAGVGVAPGTLAANANKIYLITSQRDLSATFGVPFFYKTTAGTPINGYELNEYGLLAAYSALGVSNRCYVQRVDIDLAELTASLVRPTDAPPAGTYWLDTAESLWGVFEWNQTTNAFSNKVPTVITDAAYLIPNSTVPLQSYGNIGDYAVTATSVYNPGYFKRGGPTASQTTASFHGTDSFAALYNTWALIGSDEWKSAWPTVQGSKAPGSLTNAQVIVINGETVTVGSGGTALTVTGLMQAINTAAISGVYAANIGGKLTLYCDSTTVNSDSTDLNGAIEIGAGSTSALLTALGLTVGTFLAPEYYHAPSYQVPRWRTTDAAPAPTGSVWQKFNSVSLGTNIAVKQYNDTLGLWVLQNCPVYNNDAEANNTYDPTGGGKNIPAGTLYAQIDYDDSNTSSFEVLERIATGPTNITGSTSTPGPFVANNTFTISASAPGSSTFSTPVTATLPGTLASDFISAVSSANVPYVTASISSSGAIVISHTAGGDIILENTSGTPLTTAGFTDTTTQVRINYNNGAEAGIILSNWTGTPEFSYTPRTTAPDQDPANGRLWYYSSTTQVDIMIQNNGQWLGYQNVTNDVRGDNLTLTNASGPIFSTTAPLTQNDPAQSDLVFGDLWIDTSDLENYPALYRWTNTNGAGNWVKLDNTDQTSENGILFADARWAAYPLINPVSDPLPTIESLLTSNYLDIDAPDAALYPQGMLLFNTRRSGFNVKSFQADYFNAIDFDIANYSNTTTYSYNEFVLYNGIVYVHTSTTPSTGVAPTDLSRWTPINTNTWLTASGNRVDGSPYMGRQAQRALIVAALKSGIDSNTTIREEQNQFNLIACPEYPELTPNMVALNNERNNTAFVVADTPLRLTPSEIVNWATNNSGLGLPAQDSLTTGSAYCGTFYPSCTTTDLGGSVVVQPPSHMMLRTIIRSDEVAYPWLAPAGTRRGVIDNATQIGYINAATGEFVTTGINQGLRDVLYENRINPITFVPGVGITNFGNKTVTSVNSALNRINVARLIAFIRGRLETIGKQYLFEPNDQITRNEITNSINSLMIDLVAKRGIYDYLVVCDLTNNTPSRIDANELWVDIAIEPVKAVEFVYIPVRIKNTGEIASQSV